MNINPNMGPPQSELPEHGASRNSRPVYLDYQATTPTDPEVVEAMLPYFTEKFGNPHSTGHYYGWEASDGVELAREQIANLIGATHREIVFTSGATESNNIALKGLARFYSGHKSHIITLAPEHKCVLETCAQIEKEGYDLTILPVQANGIVDLELLSETIREETLFVSIMAVHNEYGIIQPMKEIGALCRERGVFFHTDAAQAFGKISLDVEAMNIDLMSISGHKIYGPMGIGALYVRRRPRVRLTPLFDGGGQERGVRSGTLPAPLCVGLGKASEKAGQEMIEETKRLTELRDGLLERLQGELSEVSLNGGRENRLPGNLNLSFAGVSGEDLVSGLKGLAVSSGSACTSTSVEPSYALKALGLSHEAAASSIRIGIGRFTTEKEVSLAADMIISLVSDLRKHNSSEIQVQNG